MSGEELAFAALIFTTASPGTTGPALILTSRAVTGVGAPTVFVEEPVKYAVPSSVLVALLIPSADGKFALPSGATTTPAVLPEK